MDRNETYLYAFDPEAGPCGGGFVEVERRHHFNAYIHPDRDAAWQITTPEAYDPANVLLEIDGTKTDMLRAAEALLRWRGSDGFCRGFQDFEPDPSGPKPLTPGSPVDAPPERILSA